MPVSIIRREPPKQKESDFDKVLKAATLANALVGTAGGVQKILGMDPASKLAETKAQRDATTFEQAQTDRESKLANIATLKDPNSQQSVLTRTALKNMGVNVPENMSAFESQQAFGSPLGTMISTQNRIAATQANAQARREATEQRHKDTIDLRKQEQARQREKDRLAKEERERKKQLELESREVPGFGYAKTKQAASALKEQRAAVDSASEQIDRLIEIAKEPFDSLRPGLRAEAENIVAGLRGNMRLVLIGPGAVSDEERKVLNSAIANPTDVFSFDSLSITKLKTLKNTMQNKFRAGLRSEGLLGQQQPQQQRVADQPQPQPLKLEVNPDAARQELERRRQKANATQPNPGGG